MYASNVVVLDTMFAFEVIWLVVLF
jgi:hypothetical protein